HTDQGSANAASGSINGATGSATIPGANEGITTLLFQAFDDAGTKEVIVTTTNGQASTSLPSLTIKVDKTSPIVQCTPPVAAWQAADVSVPCMASDAGSGLATPANFSVTTAVQVGTETNAAQTIPVNVSDIAGNTVSTGTFGPFMVDKKFPGITGPT